MPEATFTVIVVVAKDTVEDACKTPAIWREEAIVDEAEEIKPPFNKSLVEVALPSASGVQAKADPLPVASAPQ